MLSRTAEYLYWISRYMERAETTARLLDVGYRMSLFPNPSGYNNEWESVLSAAGELKDIKINMIQLNKEMLKIIYFSMKVILLPSIIVFLMLEITH